MNQRESENKNISIISMELVTWLLKKQSALAYYNVCFVLKRGNTLREKLSLFEKG